MASNVDASGLLNILDSSDISAGEEIKELILENLRCNKEAWLVYGVVEFFVVSQSQRCLDILETIREPHDRQLFDKLVECIKGQNKLPAITILGYLVTKQPPWLHRITSHSLMQTLIKLLKIEVDVPILVSGVLTVTSLLPVVPVSIRQYLPELLEAFSRLAAFNFKKPGNVPDIYLMHLHVAVYSLFHRLHGMYPCHLLTYLRSYYRKKENQIVFHNTIAPMLERVKMHPLLVVGSQEKEISSERWRQKEVHDIIVECAQLSLDMIEGTMEKVTCPFTEALSDLERKPQQIIMHEPTAGAESNAETPNSIVNSVAMLDSLWSPSLMCGLSTPPPESITTNTSTVDVNASSGHGSNHSIQPNTPRNTPLVHDSPLPAIDMERVLLTPVTSQGEVCPPLTPGGTCTSKRLSAMSLSLSGKLPTTPTTSDSIIPPSPLKFDFSQEPPLHAQKMQAIRKLTFHSSPQSEKPIEEPQASHAHSQAVAEALRDVKASHEQKSEAVADSASKDAVLSPRGKKRPPPLKCMQHSDSLEFSSIEDTKPTQAEQHPVTIICSPNKKDDGELSQSVPSVNQLPDIIDSLHRGSITETGSDEEVQEITGSRDMLDQDDTTSDDSYGTPASALTAQSVKAFMKKVNRIRFNSMNVGRIREDSNGDPRPKPLRSRSCPNLDPEFEGIHVYIGGSLQPKRKRYHSGSGPQLDIIQSDSALIKGAVMTSPTIGSTPTKNTSVISFTKEAVIEEEEDGIDFNVISDDDDDDKAAEEEQQVLDNFIAMFPYYRLFPMSLPSALFMKCYNCQRGEDCNSVAAENNANLPFFATLSPPDLLDRHITLGAELHRKQLEALHNNADSSPAPTAKSDDLEIARGQVQLLHNQVMYERHKRELYAKRNRRLLGRITKATALEEQNVAMQDQLRLQEHEIQNFLLTVRLQQRELHEARLTKEQLDKELADLRQANRRDVDKLQNEKRDLQNIVDQKIKDNGSLKRDLLDKKSQLFNFVHELNALRTKADFASELQEQVTRLNKELLLMGELQQKYQQRLMALSTMHNPRRETQFILETYKQELSTTRLALDQRTRDYDALLAHSGQLEESLANKDGLIKEQKHRLEDMDSVVKAQVAAVEDKYSVQKKITTALGAHILELTAKLEEARSVKPVESESESESAEACSSNSLAGAENNQVEFQVEEAKECRETPPSDLSPVSPSRTNIGKN